jgi:enamine deaminase RidA (YjgF/YER057c/UK114 family)
MDIEKKLKELNIKLPNAPEPVGAYVAFKKIDKLLFISGQLPIDQDGKMIQGKIGKDLTTEEGYKAAERCGLSIISQLNRSSSHAFFN